MGSKFKKAWSLNCLVQVELCIFNHTYSSLKSMYIHVLTLPAGQV